jgi:hypothetical protein
MAQSLGAHPPAGHLSPGRPSTEVRVRHRQFADEGGQLGVAGALGGLDEQSGDATEGDRPPVAVDLPGAWVGEEQPDVVALLLRDPVEVGEESGCRSVPGQDFRAAAHDERGGRRQLVPETSELRLNPLRRSAALRALVAPRQREEVVTSVVVEVQDTDECGEHRRRREDPPLLQPRVAIGADARELSDLLTAELLGTP